MTAICAFRRAGVDVERQGRSCGSADWKFKIPTAWELQFVNEARADDDLRRTMRASRDVRANGRRAGPDRLNRIPRRLSGLLPGLVLCNFARGA